MVSEHVSIFNKQAECPPFNNEAGDGYVYGEGTQGGSPISGGSLDHCLSDNFQHQASGQADASPKEELSQDPIAEVINNLGAPGM